MIKRVSEMTTDEALSFFCEITPYVSNIVADPEIMEAIGKGVDKKGLTAVGVTMLGVKRMIGAVPLLFGEHRQDIYNIIAAADDEKTCEDIARQFPVATLTQIRTLLNDRILIDFFKSWARGEETE